MKIISFILAVGTWLMNLCIFLTILFIGLVVYRWLLGQIVITYPDLHISDALRVALFFGCMLTCSNIYSRVGITNKKTDEN
jgi:hypothetical protein